MPDEKIRLDSLVLLKPERTPEGFLKVPATVTRAGIFEYRNPDGSMRRELRRPEQVFRADSMASLQGKPFVDGHPYAYGGVVTPHNSRRLIRGFTAGTAYKEGNTLNVDFIITDEEAIQAAEAGKVALSAGYRCKFTGVPGEWEGQRYDDEQVDINYNHVALVKKGRAGEMAKLRLDENLNELPTPEETAMDLVTIKLDDGRDVQVASDIAAAFVRQSGAVTREKLRADEAEELFATTHKQLETVTGERDGMKTRLDGLDKEIAGRVKTRTALLTQAVAILPKAEHVKLDEMTETQIMASVIRCAAGDPALKLDEAKTDYIQGRYEAVVAGSLKKAVQAGRTLGAQIIATRTDGVDPEDGKDAGGFKTPEELREAKKQKLTSRYKRPIGSKKKDKDDE